MKKKILKIIQFFAFLSIGILFLYFGTKGIKLGKLAEVIVNARYSWVIFSLGFAALAYVSRAYRWKLLIEPLGYNPSLKNTFYALMIGYLANFAFPRIGEVTRCGSLKKTDKIPFDALVGTVIIERTIDMFVLLFLLFVLLIARFSSFGSFLIENIFLPLWQKITSSFLVLIIVFIFILLLFLLSFVFKHQLAKNSFVKKLKKLIKGVFSGIKTVFGMKKRGEFIFHTLVIWVCYFFMIYLLFFSIPATAGLGPIDGLFMMVVAGLGMSVPVQGGIGAFHWIVSLALTLYGIPKEDGLAFATISHESEAIFAIILGCLSLLMVFIYVRKNRVQPVHEDVILKKNTEIKWINLQSFQRKLLVRKLLNRIFQSGNSRNEK